MHYPITIAGRGRRSSARWLVRGVACATLLIAGCRGANPARDQLSRAPLDMRLAAADARAGAAIFTACAACHNDAENGTDRDGPNLWGVVGKPVGHNSPGFAYTAALQSVGGVWTCEKLDRWLADPRRFAPGTAMGFSGLPNGVDRADVIAYLRGNGPSPAPPCA